MFRSIKQARNAALRPSPVRQTAPCRGIVTEADVESARRYCVNQLQKGDYESYLLNPFIPSASRTLHLALRTLNLELARLPETTSSPAIAKFRLQFWRDTIKSTFSGSPPREPISILLHQTLQTISSNNSDVSLTTMKYWLLRFISMRETYVDNRPFVNMSSLEEYAEHTYATLMYILLAALPLRSVHADHLASHIGKAAGLAATVRGIPFLAAPAPPVQSPLGTEVEAGRSPVLLLPLDVLAESGVREEDVFRRGPAAEGLQDAVFKVATRSNDHLITARQMMKNLRAGQDPGHEYEYVGDSGHIYDEATAAVSDRSTGANDGAARDIKRAFGVLLEAVPTQEFLTRLESADFDIFKTRSSWKLPWSLWRAQKTQRI